MSSAGLSTRISGTRGAAAAPPPDLAPAGGAEAVARADDVYAAPGAPAGLAGLLSPAAGRTFPPEVILKSYARPVDLSTTRTDDLVLPAMVMDRFERLEKLVRQRKKVMEDWAFATRGGEAAGVTAILHGAEGHGKTLSARVLAKRLDKPLYSADLSRIQGATVAQTMSNLDRLLDAASKIDAVLLIENADVLLRERGHGTNRASDDSYLVTSYLMNKLKSHGGAVLLESDREVESTVRQAASVILEFPYPDLQQRAAIWKKAFPAGTPTSDGIKLESLAHLNLAGGSIANVARNAAALAASRGEAVSLEDIRTATYDEYSKLGRILSGIEAQVLQGTQG